jgi:hypothetical protein
MAVGGRVFFLNCGATPAGATSRASFLPLPQLLCLCDNHELKSLQGRENVEVIAARKRSFSRKMYEGTMRVYKNPGAWGCGYRQDRAITQSCEAKQM